MGGFVKVNDTVIHISSPDTLTREQIDFWEKEYDMQLTCSKCGKHLEPGDQKDHFWPYFSDYNLCKECMKKNKEDDLNGTSTELPR